MISVYLVILLTVCQISAIIYDNVAQNTELEFAFMTFRHGDRSPMGKRQLVSPSEELLKRIEEIGYGQLTNAGKRTSYKLCQFIRRRYNQLLSPQYNKSEIYIRTTQSTRTKMTALVAMSAVYPPHSNRWSEHINWEPVPYTSVPAKYDFNTAFVNCPDFVVFQDNIETQKSTRMDRYVDVLAKVSCASKFNITSTPIMAYNIYDIFVSEQNLGHDLGNRLSDLMPAFEFAASEAMDIIYGDHNYIALEAGVLLNEFFKYANQIINCTDTQRVRVYSAHDFNVYALESVSKVNPRQGYPKYCSLFSLELRRVVETGEFIVLPVYLPSPNEKEIYLAVEGCGTPCSFDKFKEITSEYHLDVDSWRTKCNFTEDYAIDDWTLE